MHLGGGYVGKYGNDLVKSCLYSYSCLEYVEVTSYKNPQTDIVKGMFENE